MSLFFKMLVIFTIVLQLDSVFYTADCLSVENYFPIKETSRRESVQKITTLVDPSAPSNSSLLSDGSSSSKTDPELNSCFTSCFEWIKIDEGLDFSVNSFSSNLLQENNDLLVLLRIDPNKYAFSLHMASEEGEELSIADRAKKWNLRAAINASMYLGDKLTSIGYMRSGEHVNNKKMGKRLGSFFLAEPEDKTLPLAFLTDYEEIEKREQLEKRDLVARYNVVAQNYRLINSDKSILWDKSNSPSSIAALGMDEEGRIYFILSQEPKTQHYFSTCLVNSLSSLSHLTYLEGGREAHLYLSLPLSVLQKGEQMNTLFHAEKFIARHCEAEEGDTEEEITEAWATEEGAEERLLGEKKYDCSFIGKTSFLGIKGSKKLVVPNLLGIHPR